MNMKRLTYDYFVDGHHCWQVEGADNMMCSDVCAQNEDRGCTTCPIAKAFDRLAAIENILGDDYDLDELRKIVELYRCSQIVLNPTPEDVEKFKAMKGTEPVRLTPCVGKDMTVHTTPLTLEQLINMNDEPVWLKSLDSDNAEWAILRVVLEPTAIWYFVHSGSKHVYGNVEEYGKTWLAYAYPPAHIDREAWKSCYTCEDDNCGTCVNAGLYRHCDPCDKCDGDTLNQYKSANFCPKCGRPLTDEAWDMLEKRLRG